MAILASSTLQFSNPLASSFAKSSIQKQQQSHSKPSLSFTARAVDPETETSAAETDTTGILPTAADDNTDSFDNRLDQVRLRYRSGAGKKAEARKGKKSKKGPSGGGGVFLPPVPLKEPVSGGLKVEFGFSPYTEMLNGRLAGLGLAALLLVELASGKSLIRYHSPAVVFSQIYFVAAVSAVFVKYEKERVSVWPRSVVGEKK